jgi:hypothetical protein
MLLYKQQTCFFQDMDQFYINLEMALLKVLALHWEQFCEILNVALVSTDEIFWQRPLLEF